MERSRRGQRERQKHRAQILAVAVLMALVCGGHALFQGRAAAQKPDGQQPPAWVTEIEQTFIRSEDCKQCHDRHYEEWKGMREQTPDLKTFGRVDAALLHGTALESPVFRTVLGLWLQTNPSTSDVGRCLSCHAPAVTVFPQHADKISAQVLSGKVEVEGIGCASCHLINSVAESAANPPIFKLQPGKVMFGPYAEPEENLVHPSSQSDLYRGANYCTACHFDKVKDVARRDLPGEILQGTICQDCHMEPSTGSSTSKRGAMTRGIGRHWFRGVVIPGIMLKNRNLQAEWMPRVDIEANKSAAAVEGTILVRTGSLPHSFPDGDPILKQFFITIALKDGRGETIATLTQQFGRPYSEILRGPIPEPFVKGGTTRRVPFKVEIPAGKGPTTVEALLTYALIPDPDPDLKARYLATLKGEKEREEAARLIQEYAQPRVLTFRTRAL
jgi:nitrate/TMAO reductase-like tetraheme cytochrome c subunit